MLLLPVIRVVGMLYKACKHVGVIVELQLAAGVASATSDTRRGGNTAITGGARSGPENLDSAIRKGDWKRSKKDTCEVVGCTARICPWSSEGTEYSNVRTDSVPLST